jgi:uncharacterized membrane protein YphA (DoxX/SURF4 family)
MKLTKPSSDTLALLALRVGLAIVFLYAVIDGALHPADWTGYFPSFLTTHISAEVLLKIFELVELVVAVLLIAGLYVRYVALLSTLMLLGIVVTNFHLLPISFRDIGLALASLALFFATPKPEKDKALSGRPTTPTKPVAK